MNGKEIREEYLRNRSATPVWGRVDKYENATGIELLYMDKTALIEMIDSWEQTSPGSVRNDLLALRQYFDWMIEHHYLTNNVAREISYHDIDYVRACKRGFFPNIETILQELNVVGAPEEGFPIYPLVIFAWNGIALKEAPQLARAAVDFSNASIDCQSQLTFEQLSPLMVDVLWRYDQCRGHIRNNNIPKAPGSRQFFLYYMDYVNQQNGRIAEKRINPSSCLGAFNRDFAQKHHLKPLLYPNIEKSGRLYKLYALEKDGIDWTEKVNASFLQDFLNAPQAYPGDAMIVYESYKKAFDLK